MNPVPFKIERSDRLRALVGCCAGAHPLELVRDDQAMVIAGKTQWLIRQSATTACPRARPHDGLLRAAEDEIGGTLEQSLVQVGGVVRADRVLPDDRNPTVPYPSHQRPRVGGND